MCIHLDIDKIDTDICNSGSRSLPGGLSLANSEMQNILHLHSNSNVAKRIKVIYRSLIITTEPGEVTQNLVRVLRESKSLILGDYSRASRFTVVSDGLQQ